MAGGLDPTMTPEEVFEDLLRVIEEGKKAHDDEVNAALIRFPNDTRFLAVHANLLWNRGKHREAEVIVDRLMLGPDFDPRAMLYAADVFISGHRFRLAQSQRTLEAI